MTAVAKMTKTLVKVEATSAKFVTITSASVMVKAIIKKIAATAICLLDDDLLSLNEISIEFEFVN